MRSKNFLRYALLALATGVGLPLLVAACASIVSGKMQDVGFSSTPGGATVSVDKQEVGKTPVTAKLTRKDEHEIRIAMDGYRPFDLKLTKSLNGWFFGNIVFGGIIGIIVDASNGAMYKLTPNQVAATLQRQGVSFLYREDAIYVAVVLNPDPTWERIGELEPFSD